MIRYRKKKITKIKLRAKNQTIVAPFSTVSARHAHTKNDRREMTNESRENAFHRLPFSPALSCTSRCVTTPTSLYPVRRYRLPLNLNSFEAVKSERTRTKGGTSSAPLGLNLYRSWTIRALTDGRVETFFLYAPAQFLHARPQPTRRTRCKIYETRKQVVGLLCTVLWKKKFFSDVRRTAVA